MPAHNTALDSSHILSKHITALSLDKEPSAPKIIQASTVTRLKRP
jgi:hypothetical protein